MSYEKRSGFACHSQRLCILRNYRIKILTAKLRVPSFEVFPLRDIQIGSRADIRLLRVKAYGRAGW
jgi:hypothetical protein